MDSPINGPSAPSLACPRCQKPIDIQLARKNWVRLGKAKAVNCNRCGAECLPDLRLTWKHYLLSVPFIIFNLTILDKNFLNLPLWGILVSLICLLLLSRIVYSLFYWHTIGNSKAILIDSPDEVEPVPDNLSSEILENADGTFTVKDKTYNSWKSAEAYLDLLSRTQKKK